MSTSSSLPLAARAAGATSVAELHTLLLESGHRRSQAVEAVARHGVVLDAGLVLLILASGSGAPELLLNPARPIETDELVIRWALGNLRHESARDPLALAEYLLRTLAQRRPETLPADGPDVQEVLAIATPAPRARTYAERQRAAQRVLLAHPGLSTAQLDGVAAALAGPAFTWDDRVVASDARVSPAVLGGLLRAALEAPPARADRPSSQQLGTWAARPDLRRDATVAPLLADLALRLGGRSVLLDLLRDPDPAALAALPDAVALDLAARLLPSLPDAEAVEPLIQAFTARGTFTRLGRAALTRWLATPQREVRLAALQALGRADPVPAVPPVRR